MTDQSLALRGGTLLAPQVDYILLDGSGSMQDKWYENLSAIDHYVEVLAQANLNAQMILATFDGTDCDCIQRDQRIAEWQPLHVAPIGAHYTDTPLYDAINAMGRRLRTLDPPKCHIVIVTDGDENASEYTTLTQARAILDWCRAKGWQVTFLGTGFDNAKQAKLLGSIAQSAIGVRKEAISDAAGALAHKRVAYGHSGSDIHFDENDRTAFGGYLGHTP